MSRLALPLALASFLAALAVGCPGGEIRCQQSSDCPGHVNCIANRCVFPDGGNSDSGTDGGTDGGEDAGLIDSGVSCSVPTLSAGGDAGPASDPGSCQKPRTPSALPAGQQQNLGTRAVGSTVTFSVPAQTWSLSIVTQAVNAGGPVNFNGSIENSVYPDLLRDPSSNTWFDSDDTSAPESRLAFLSSSPPMPSTGAMTLPNTSPGLAVQQSPGFPAGTWSFQLVDVAFACLSTDGCTGGTDAGAYDVTVLTKTGTPPASGTVDIDIYLVTSALGIDRTTAPTNANVQRFVGTMRSLFRQAGICLGNVQFWDVPQWAKDRYASSVDVDEEGPCSDLSQMFTLSTPGRRAIPMFFVDALVASQSGGQTVLGVDGTIPGPGSFGGTIASGAAITASVLPDESLPGACAGPFNPLQCGADQVAYISAHEIGHFMGLYHTSEGTGVAWDPLNSTSICVCSACQSSTSKACLNPATNLPADPYFISPSECRSAAPPCQGADNLMFWAFRAGISIGRVTSEQGRVMRANPAVQ